MCDNSRSQEHVVYRMSDFDQLLQTIRALQPSRLSYIELLQEEVKRKGSVSDLLVLEETCTVFIKMILSYRILIQLNNVSVQSRNECRNNTILIFNVLICLVFRAFSMALNVTLILLSY